MTGILRFKSLAAASALLLLVTAAPATSDDGFSWSLEGLELGFLQTGVDTDSAKFQEYRDLDSGVQASFRLVGESADGDRTLSLVARSIGRNDARYTLDYGLAGRYALEIDYNQIQHLFGNNSAFIWDIPRAGFYDIPDVVQQQFEQAIRDRAANISPFAVNADFLGGLIQPLFDNADRVDLGLQRDRTRLRFDLGKMGRTAWAFEYRNENRRGGRPFSGSFGFFNVIEIFEPIAYQTTDAEISGEWNGKKGGLQFGYRSSTFENDVSTIFWDNPWFGADSTDGSAYLSPSGLSQNGPVQGFADLAPDNESSTLWLSGRGRSGSWWANGNISMIEMTQDEPFLPYTLNTAIEGMRFPSGETFDPTTVSTLPATRADNQVDVLNLSANVGTDFNEDWSLVFRYRYYDYDVRSRQFDFDGYVRFHAVWEAIPRTNVPYDYSRDRLEAELGWQATENTSLSLSYGIENFDRSFRETGSTEEDSIKLTVDSKATDNMMLRASWETGDRSFDAYDPLAQLDTFIDPHGADNQPGLRKYAQNAREFDDYEIQAQIFGSSAWNYTVGISGRTEDYTKGVFGLLSDEILSYNFEVAYNPGAALNCYVFGHFADRESFQRARQSGSTVSTDPLDDWELLLNEANTTLGLGLTSDGEGPWSYDLSAYYSESDGEADFTTPPGGRDAVDFDNYEDIELLGVDLQFDYELGENTAIGFRYLYEDYTINSFNLQGLQNFLPSTLLLVPSFGDYQASVFGVSLKVKI